MIKAIIFDVGGVLVRTHDHSGRRSWERQLGLAAGAAEAVVFNSDMGTKAQLGTITNTDLWRWIGEHLGLADDSLRRFRRDFWAGDRLDEELIAYIHALRPRYQTAIISNATDNLRFTLSSVYPITDAFDLIVGSAEEGIMKPDPRIYRRALARLDCSPEEAVFIDDSEANVTSARRLGIKALHFREGMDVPVELAALGVLPTAGGDITSEE